MSNRTLGDIVRERLAHMAVEELCGNVQPYSIAHHEGLAFKDDPTLDRQPVTYIPHNRLRSRERQQETDR